MRVRRKGRQIRYFSNAGKWVVVDFTDDIPDSEVASMSMRDKLILDAISTGLGTRGKWFSEKHTL